MNYFPIFIDCDQLNVLVVGGGEVASRKVELMLKTPANITVVSPKFSASLSQLGAQNRVELIDGPYHPEHLQGKQLVFVATSNFSLNQQISEQAKALNILANVVDSPALCHFITPSIVDRSPMTFALCSEGQAPVLLRYWREKLEALVPTTLAQLAKFGGKKRQQIKNTFDSCPKRRRFWQRFYNANRSEDPEQHQAWFDELLQASSNDESIVGELTVIKCPVHPDQLTLAALRHMQSADIGLYDAQTSALIIDLLRRDASREAISDDWQQQLSSYLEQSFKVCYLVTEPNPQQQVYWLQLQAQGVSVKLIG